MAKFCEMCMIKQCNEISFFVHIYKRWLYVSPSTSQYSGYPSPLPSPSGQGHAPSLWTFGLRPYRVSYKNADVHMCSKETTQRCEDQTQAFIKREPSHVSTDSYQRDQAIMKPGQRENSRAGTKSREWGIQTRRGQNEPGKRQLFTTFGGDKTSNASTCSHCLLPIQKSKA